MKHCLRIITACLALLLPMAVFAADGYVVGNVNLRAGPDSGYPAVRMLPAGAPVAIQGCLDDWSWCDVVAFGDRGWVAGNFLQYEYQNRRVYVPDYGVRIGLPIVSFVLGSYWENHYRNRPWYGRRTYWSGRHFHHRAPPRPAHPIVSPRPPHGTRPPIHGPRPPVQRPRPPVQRPGTRPAPAVQRPARPSANRPAQRPNPPASATKPMQRPAPRPNATTRPGTHPMAPAQRPAARPAPAQKTGDRGDRKKDDQDRH